MTQPRWQDSWPWVVTGLGLLLMLYLLAPILTPFVIGAGLAYLGDPLVDRLERWHCSRTVGVSLVFVVIIAVTVISVGLLVPTLHRQLSTLIQNLPDWLRWVQDTGLPSLGLELPADLKLDADSLRRFATEHWGQAQGLFSMVWTRISSSSMALLTAGANLLLVPIVTFYLMRDWDKLVVWIAGMLPRPWLPRVSEIAHETDSVLGGFVRGQLSVMAVQTVYYWIALWLAGLELALIVGLIVGAISFVPYLGTIIGILTAVIAMLIQTHDLYPLIWIGVVFGIGQILESNILTPWLVGDRIGLHPVAVIFAVMAGGQLFGFLGVLLALPVAAVIAVMMRHTRDEWLKSVLYRGHSEPAPGAPGAPGDVEPQ